MSGSGPSGPLVSVLCLLCLCARLFIIMCLVVTCWERADLLALVCGFVTFPFGRAKTSEN